MQIRSLLLIPTALALALPASAQRSSSPRVEIALPSQAVLASEGPLVRGVELLSARGMHDLLTSGFPARLTFRTELWSTRGLFNTLERRTEWEIVVTHDPLNRSFHLARRMGDGVPTIEGPFTGIAQVDAAVARWHQAPLTPPSGGQRYYYNVVCEVEVISLSDLDELERWLRGELQPAVKGQRNPGTALTRGLRTLLVRLLGGEKRRYEARTPTFATDAVR